MGMRQKRKKKHKIVFYHHIQPVATSRVNQNVRSIRPGGKLGAIHCLWDWHHPLAGVLAPAAKGVHHFRTSVVPSGPELEA